MEPSLAVYLPQDRRHALARGEALPEHTHGAALFADIAGFTPLTEALDRALGPRRGAEALVQQINTVYDVLIAQVDRYGGSVISFAGDSLTCWFDQSLVPGPLSFASADTPDMLDKRQGTDESVVRGPLSVASADTPDMLGKRQGTNDNGLVTALRVVGCALALQAAMRRFAAIPLPDGSTAALALKVAIASGPARRFAVGDPALQLIDTLAGTTLARMAAGEHLAQPGEVLLDAPTAAALGDTLSVAEWRMDVETGERFAVLAGLQIADCRLQIEEVSGQSAICNLQSAIIRPWLLPAVYERHAAGLGDFLTELRPVVALFVHFGGIDYDRDPDAGAKLDALVRRAQQTLACYDGALLQLTIGDKGSYLYATFGAPTAHEDDPRRAARAALEWLALPDELDFLPPLQIGISRGVLRTGACGGATRRTYSAMGDEVNLAARLMSRAAPGEALISGRVQAALAAEFALEPLEPIPLKGMPEPLPIFRLAGERARAVRLSEPAYALPMVGRQAELALIGQKLDRALEGHGQIVGITAEAGMGKSRLVAEAIRLARRKRLRGYGGACQSYGANTPYLVWGPIWRGFFDLDIEWPARKQIRMLEGAVEDLAPERLEALPLLGPLLGLSLAENDFTRTLEPRSRESALHALLLDCVRAAARQAAEDGTGLLLVLEDLHWIDAASHDLLEQIARASVDLPVLIVAAYRPPELLRLQAPRVEALEHFTRVALAPLTEREAAQAIRAKLAQLLPERKGASTPQLIARITAKAQGNPFYVEELLNYLRDRGIDPQDAQAIETLDLPASLHTLILSRIDQLSERERATLKVASVIGRLFQFAHLHGAFPMLGEPISLRANLDELSRLDLTPLDSPEPELTYLFKHIVTQEVAYESLTAQARASLHEQLARFFEARDAEGALDLLAFHYERSDNQAKAREYLRRAGEAAAARFANDTAVDYLTRALAVTPEDELAERWAVLRARERVYDMQGVRDAQARDLDALEVLAVTLDDTRRAEAAAQRANYAFHIGDHRRAIEAAERAVTRGQAAGALTIVAEAYFSWAWALLVQGSFDAARTRAEASLVQARASDDHRGEGRAFLIFGTIAFYQADYRAAQDYCEQGLRIARVIGDRWNEGQILNILGGSAVFQREYHRGQIYLEQSLRSARAIGDRLTEGWAFGNLGEIARLQGDYHTAHAHFEQCLGNARAIGDQIAEALALSNMSLVAQHQGDYAAASTHSQQAIAIARANGDRYVEALVLAEQGPALLGLGSTAEAADVYQAALDLQRALGHSNFVIEPQAGLARVALARGDVAAALVQIEEILAYLGDGGRLDGTNEELRVYLTCYRVLQAAGDPRADGILTAAYNLLQEQAGKIADEAMQRLFLENVPYHRDLVAAWKERHSE